MGGPELARLKTVLSGTETDNGKAKWRPALAAVCAAIRFVAVQAWPGGAPA